MTHNQINYWNYVENARSNKAKEHLTKEQNVETNRSNLVREYLTSQQNAETKRANLAKESLTLQANTEAQRHNKATEVEANRHNVKVEDESFRHNMWTEENDRTSISNRMTVDSINAVETQRHNEAMENIQKADVGTKLVGHLISREGNAANALATLTSGITSGLINAGANLKSSRIGADARLEAARMGLEGKRLDYASRLLWGKSGK